MNVAELCLCPDKRPAVRTIANGTRQYGWQCPECGQWKPASKQARQTFASVIEFDPQLLEQYRQLRTEYWEQQRADERAAWFRAHNDYLKTEAWARRCRLVMKRDKGLCMARLEQCTTAAAQVHHLTYRHWQNEPLWDLEAVCEACHDEITRMERGEL